MGPAKKPEACENIQDIRDALDEILIAFLKNPKYRLLPLLDVIQHHIHPLQQEIQWGYHIPYLITGALNEHPRSAMKWMASDKKDDFVTFMKEMHDYELLE